MPLDRMKAIIVGFDLATDLLGSAQLELEVSGLPIRGKTSDGD